MYVNWKGMKSIRIKPFLSCEPFVNVVHLNEEEIGVTDMLVLGCDGVFDVLSNEDVINEVRRHLWLNHANPHAFSQLTPQDILQNYSITFESLDNACSKLGNLAYDRGTIDDVTAFAVPLWFIMHSPLLKTPSYGVISHRKASVLDRESTHDSTLERKSVVSEDRNGNAEQKVDRTTLILAIPLQQSICAFSQKKKKKHLIIYFQSKFQKLSF
ncbi:protein phosphatase 1M [Reticulomyxa filosa]|uniref:Protein phosphatase 1M n=1 Tax=Reticulomyxa filosa TaxID=46433 RepID=X6LKB9_RETFI|nr:protein phosphatase 1M [Reticulomyxa filosa]|eukprot:ETO01811.1 protein phosphatase 1M [Reticulomyxa filosa]